MDEIIILASVLHDKMENSGTMNYLSMSEADKLAFNDLFDSLETFLKK